MKRFVVDFGNEEEMPEPPRVGEGIPSPLYMITSKDYDFVDEARKMIVRSGMDMILLKYKRTNSDHPRFAIGFEFDTIQRKENRDYLNRCGGSQMGKPYFFVIYYDPTVTTTADVVGTIPKDLGRGTSLAKKSTLDFIEILKWIPGHG
jgi:hypothetical protein